MLSGPGGGQQQICESIFGPPRVWHVCGSPHGTHPGWCPYLRLQHEWGPLEGHTNGFITQNGCGQKMSGNPSCEMCSRGLVLSVG